VTDIGVLVVDDHALVREMLADRISAERGMHITAQAATSDDAVRVCDELRPDVVLLDIDLPGISAFDAARKMNSSPHPPRIIFLSAFIQDRYIANALDVRAAGYLSKTTPPSEVIDAIRTVVVGRTAMCAEVLDRLVFETLPTELGVGVGARRTLLTQREREVVALIAVGLQQKQVAVRMGISIKTVQTHLVHAMDKLEIHDRVELARYAIREGLVVMP
jgi:NarL family two-component system response regulator LiaR